MADWTVDTNADGDRVYRCGRCDHYEIRVTRHVLRLRPDWAAEQVAGKRMRHDREAHVAAGRPGRDAE